MFSRNSLVTAVAAIGFVLVAAASMHAGGYDTHKMYLTFNRPVALPGVSLPGGTYRVEIADGAHDVVRVMSRDGKVVYFSAFTYTIPRPAGMPQNQLISFKETAPGRTPSIAAWWPEGDSGREFIYASK